MIFFLLFYESLSIYEFEFFFYDFNKDLSRLEYEF